MGAGHRNYGRAVQRPAQDRKATGHTFLIVVEGEATERLYLEEVRVRIKRKAAALLVHHGDHTDPVGVVREAIKLRDAQSARPNAEPYDRVWVVVDREKQNHPRREQMPAALKLAEANDIQVAISIPSIEFWLLLHFEFTTKAFDGCDAVKKALKKFIKKYEKADLPLDDLLGRVETAVKNAGKCHGHWESAGGDGNPSTHLDKLIKELNDSSPVRLF